MPVEELPRYSDLMLPTLRAIDALGGSGSAREITAKVIEIVNPSDEHLALTYENRPAKSILLDRMDWARSYCKLGGALDSPRRNLFLVTTLGREILQLPEAGALERLLELDRTVRAARRNAPGGGDPPNGGGEPGGEPGGGEGGGGDSDVLREKILSRLHLLSPDAFEEFCLYVLRAYGLELTRVGGTGDEGIDGIGTAPLSDVLSATVAVQVKRDEPSRVVSRDKVALLQRDASAKGAERAVFVTLGRFGAPAQNAARQTTPTVDLIDGQRLCELMEQKQIGLALSVDEAWFDRFEQSSG